MTIKLLLASSSIYRKELLSRLQLPFECISPDIDESPLNHEYPKDLATRLAYEKSRALWSQLEPHTFVISSDQVGDLHGREVLNKPGTMEVAIAQLERLSGQEAVFRTAVYGALIGPQKKPIQSFSACVDTNVRYRQLSRQDILSHLAMEPALDCAGSAKIESLGIQLIDRFQTDDPTAIMGLPLITICNWLRTIGLLPHTTTTNSK